MQGNNTFKETTVNDYLPALYEKFPDIPKKDIKIIVEYGWRLLYLANIAGCDTLIQSQSNKFWFYIGYLTKSPLHHFNYYRKKLFKKIKFMFRRIKPEFDEWYYTALTKEEYEEFYKDTHKRGRKKTKFLFVNKVSFRNKDACFLYYHTCNCIIRYKCGVDLGFSYRKEKLEVNSPEIVLVKGVSTFKDILVDNNEYELI